MADFECQVQRLKFSAKNRAHTRAELEEASNLSPFGCFRSDTARDDCKLRMVIFLSAKAAKSEGGMYKPGVAGGGKRGEERA